MGLRFYISALFLVCLTFSALRLEAAFLGADMTYVSLGGDSFQVKVTVYSDCRNLAVAATPISITEWSTQKSIVVNTSKLSGYDFTPLCSSACNPCSSATCTNNYGFRADYLYAVINLSSYKKGSFTISWGKCCRSSTITTGAAGEDFYLEAYLNNSVKKNNSSPQFTLPPQIVLLNQQYYTISAGVVNDDTASSDYDSLVYKWVSPLKDKGASISYSTSYGYTYPFLFNGYPYSSYDPENKRGYHINPQTGLISVQPIQTDVSVMAFAVEEWHKDPSGKWVKISEVRRDCQVNIVADSLNHLPVIYGGNGVFGNKIYFQAGKSKCFSIASHDVDQNDSVRLSWSSAIKGMNISASSSSGKSQSITICWEPSSADARKYPYLLTVTARDNSCFPLTGIVQNVYQIFVDTFPTADFLVQDACVGHSVNFTNKTDDAKGYMSYHWEFGDGKWSNSVSPSHIYAASGNYTAKLVISYGKRKIDSLEKQLHIVSPPHANIRVNRVTQCAGDNKFIFQAPKDTAMQYFWDLGNGQAVEDIRAEAVYKDTGSYIVKLIMKSMLGCMDTGSTRVYVVREKADFYFKKDSIQCVYGNAFAPQLSVPLNGISWDFGDGNTSLELSPAHSYSKAGHYTVTLSGTTAAGCQVSCSHTVLVTDMAADFQVSTPASCAGTPFDFKNGSTSSDALPLSYFWSFGDGQTSTEKDPSHAYAKGGNYEVVLTVSDGKGCTDKKKLGLQLPELEAEFISQADKDCAGIPFAFTNLSATNTAQPMLYTWDFGDKQTSTSVNPVHSYANPGRYVVKLYAQLPSGCTDSFADVINIYHKPDVNIEGPDSVPVGDTAVFEAGEDIDGSFYWSHGSAKVIGSVANQIKLRWDTLGTYTLKVRGVNHNTDCEDSSQVSVIVYQPTAMYRAEPTNWQLLRMYPNPAQDRLSLDFYAATREKMSVYIYNASGRNVESQEFYIIGHTQQTINLAKLPAGIYLVRIVSSQGQHLEKLFIQ